jgi:hypothetical protein
LAKAIPGKMNNPELIMAPVATQKISRSPKSFLSRDLPFDVIIGTPARYSLQITTREDSISTTHAINTVTTPARKTPRDTNPLENPVFGHFFDAP